jgi:hypothetical protein
MAKRKNFRKDHYVIIGYSTEDEYELPVKIYLTLEEMAADLKITIKKVYNLIQTEARCRETKLKYMKVRCDY